MSAAKIAEAVLDILNLFWMLVQPNSEVLLIRPGRILDVSELLFGQGPAEPGSGHLWVKV
jgi:hypothetical protein